MKKMGIINSKIAAEVAKMRHMDWLSIGDAGMPVPAGTKQIDIALDQDMLTFMATLENVLQELKVQKIYLADEITTDNPKQLENIKAALPDIEIEFMPHTELKQNLAKTHAFIRTGEMTPYSNIILESSVTF